MKAALYGAGGHGKVALSVLRSAGFEVEAAFDDAANAPQRVGRVGVVGGFDAWSRGRPAVHLAIGSNAARRALAERMSDAQFVTAVSPHAVVDEDARLGQGVFVAPMSVVQSAAKIGRLTLINTAAVVEHDCTVGAFCHVAPRAVLGGGVTLGDGVLIGLGAVVLPGVEIGAGVVVGAGAVVARDVPPGATARGVPARWETASS